MVEGKLFYSFKKGRRFKKTGAETLVSAPVIEGANFLKLLAAVVFNNCGFL